MEGMFAFFMESAFVGALIWGEGKAGPRFICAALAVARVELTYQPFHSGYRFMQHPVAYRSNRRLVRTPTLAYS
jgi:cytochrome d ubiquinol oxidase subunit I